MVSRSAKRMVSISQISVRYKKKLQCVYFFYLFVFSFKLIYIFLVVLCCVRLTSIISYSFLPTIGMKLVRGLPGSASDDLRPVPLYFIGAGWGFAVRYCRVDPIQSNILLSLERDQ